MPKEPFQFKQFSLQHHKSPMALGVDSMTLGSWANCIDANSILDIGTGCGVLSMMCAQRNEKAQIEGIDISEEAIIEATYNATLSKWNSRLHFKKLSLQEYLPNTPIDLIISNPPFFEPYGKLSPEIERANARHQTQLTLSELIEFAHSHLSATGIMALVLPSNHEIDSLITKYNLYLLRVCEVYPKEGKPMHRILVEIGRENLPLQLSQLTLRDAQNNYTDSYKSLTQEFYL